LHLATIDRFKYDEAVKSRKSDGTVKSFRCKARKSDGMRRTYLYAAMTEDAAQRRRDGLFTKTSKVEFYYISILQKMISLNALAFIFL